MKARILKRFGNSVRFADQKHKNEPQVVYSSDVDIKELKNFANEYKKALYDDSLVECDDNTMEEIVKDEKAKILRYAAKVMKQEIYKVNRIETLPLNPEDISLAAMERVVPEHLKHFLQCLCGASEHKLLKILSIAQSIIFVSSDAQKKMPKQVGLGVSLKASLRSREYITLLNKFGESVNYHEVLGIDTYWAEQIIERGDGYATIPTNIVFGEFAQAAFDNADFGQENASQHVANAAIYQYCRNGEFNQHVLPKMSSGKGRRRSIKIVPDPLLTVTANKKPTLTCYFRSTQIKYLINKDLSDERKAMWEKILAWLTSRMVASKILNVDVEQNVPGWSTFHSVISAKITTPTVIGNCRSVPASPTDISIVYTVLVNFKKMLTTLDRIQL